MEACPKRFEAVALEGSQTRTKSRVEAVIRETTEVVRMPFITRRIVIQTE